MALKLVHAFLIRKCLFSVLVVFLDLCTSSVRLTWFASCSSLLKHQLLKLSVGKKGATAV